MENSLLIEAVPRLQFLEQLPLKFAVLQAPGRKTARAGDKTTGFGTGSIVRMSLTRGAMNSPSLVKGNGKHGKTQGGRPLCR
jgi:hypothetical protein